MKRVLFRPEAGSRVGLGHLQRCLSLAAALEEMHLECVFLTSGERAVRDRVTHYGFVSHSLGGVEGGGDEDLGRVLQVAAHETCAGVVVDSYGVDAAYLSQLRGAGLLVIAVDDLASFTFPCHLVVNGGVQAGSLPYVSSTSDTRFLLGPTYALLRKEFRNSANRSVENRVREVLVAMGGADGRNLTPTVLKFLDDLEGDFKVTAIIGPFVKNKDEVAEVAKHCRRQVAMVRDPEHMWDLMRRADVAISAGGQTLYELAATGTPTVAVQVADNQAGNVRCFSQYGTVTPVVFDSLEQLRGALADPVQALMADQQLRERMSQAGSRLVDGFGTQRVGEALLGLLSRW